jgi:sulfur carrier protein ThiS
MVTEWFPPRTFSLSNRFISCILHHVRISVRVYGGLRGHGASKALQVDALDDATVADVVEALDLRPGEIWLATLDGQLVEMDHALQPGDELTLVPPVGGGK